MTLMCTTSSPDFPACLAEPSSVWICFTCSCSSILYMNAACLTSDRDRLLSQETLLVCFAFSSSHYLFEMHSSSEVKLKSHQLYKIICGNSSATIDHFSLEKFVSPGWALCSILSEVSVVLPHIHVFFLNFNARSLWIDPAAVSFFGG